jgi:hypothetical protein
VWSNEERARRSVNAHLREEAGGDGRFGCRERGKLRRVFATRKVSIVTPETEGGRPKAVQELETW